MTYSIIIIASWMAFLLVWGIGAIGTKPDVQNRSGSFWFWRALVIILIVIFGGRFVGVDYYAKLPFQSDPVFGWIGAACSVVGIGIAIWARVYLGRNWSAHPTQKAEHELVTTGPYGYLRHPIYTGVILALFGTISVGFIYTLVIFAVFLVIFVARIPREERIMRTLFPDQYPAYQKRTKRLIPWVW